MIHVNRPEDPPATLQSAAVARAKAQIAEIARTRKPDSKDFVSHWGSDDVRTALWEMQHHKCCYCERKREKNRESDIEHFRPKAGVTEADGDHYGYWWLAYEWSNLLFSCRYCNQQYKRNHFPVTDEAMRARTEDCPLDGEDALLLDPAACAPETHLGFDWYRRPAERDGDDQTLAYVCPRSEYGRRTIEIVGLNESDLPVERGALVLELEVMATVLQARRHMQNGVDEYAMRVERATSSQVQFAGFRRDYFRKNGLGDYVAND